MEPFLSVRNASRRIFSCLEVVNGILWLLVAYFSFRLESEVVLIRPKSRNRSGVVGEKNWSHFQMSEMPG